jgi:hypothetical protein
MGRCSARAHACRVETHLDARAPDPLKRGQQAPAGTPETSPSRERWGPGPESPVPGRKRTPDLEPRWPAVQYACSEGEAKANVIRRHPFSPTARPSKAKARRAGSEDKRVGGHKRASRPLSGARGRSSLDTITCQRSRSFCALRLSACGTGIASESAVIQAGQCFDPSQQPATSHEWHGPSGARGPRSHPVPWIRDRTRNAICFNRLSALGFR